MPVAAGEKAAPIDQRNPRRLLARSRVQRILTRRLGARTELPARVPRLNTRLTHMERHSFTHCEVLVVWVLGVGVRL
eukprot:COSAG04_NODE_2447_length_4104_cov_2.484894_6_plen_77_part_00